jgi:hypothetical protein
VADADAHGECLTSREGHVYAGESFHWSCVFLRLGKTSCDLLGVRTKLVSARWTPTGSTLSEKNGLGGAPRDAVA